MTEFWDKPAEKSGKMLAAFLEGLPLGTTSRPHCWLWKRIQCTLTFTPCYCWKVIYPHFHTVDCGNEYSAEDAAIWTEQQLVAIPGWLREDQNATLHQEEHFVLIIELFTGGEGNKMATQAIPPPLYDSGDFWAKTRKFSEKVCWFWKVASGFWEKVAHFNISRQNLGKLAGREF